MLRVPLIHSATWALPPQAKRMHLSPKLESQLAEMVDAAGQGHARKLAHEFAIELDDGRVDVIVQFGHDHLVFVDLAIGQRY